MAKKQRRNDRRISGGRKAALFAAFLVFFGCLGGYLFLEVIQPKRETQAHDEIASKMHLAELQPEEETESAEDLPSVVLPEYEALLQQNDDLRGWISVPALNLDLPIMQGIDNEYYLRRDFDGNWSLAGTPFFDYRITDFVRLPRNTVVYGHNMRRNDIMFGVFQNLRTPEGFAACPVIGVNTLYRDYRWFVYAVFITNPYEYQDNGYFFPYNFIEASDESFASYVTEIDKRKLYTTGVELTPEDKILTISTCCYDFKNARLVVVARLQRPGETDTPDTSHTQLNPSPKYPQAWYTANKMQNPYANNTRWQPE